jgi:hypothetical protein
MNEQPNTTNKLMVGGGSAALVIIIVWAVKTWAHTDIPTEVAMALSTVISLGAAHYTPVNKPKDEDCGA